MMNKKVLTAFILVFTLLLGSFGLAGSAFAASGNEVQLLQAQYGSGTFSGTINVENLAYNKNVVVSWKITGRTDGWKTTSATYSAPAAGMYEKWNFSASVLGAYGASVATSAATYGIEFYVDYYVDGQHYVDNNNGSYYHVGGNNYPASISFPAKTVSGDEVKLLHAQYGTGSFKGSVNVANIAYTKNVTVYWKITGRTDGWKSTAATYAAPNGGNFEAWEFNASVLGPYSASVATSAGVYGIEFYLDYYVNGQHYVDNNNGSYYHVGGYDYQEAILKQPAVKMGEIAFGTNNNFKGHVYLQNLASSKEVKIIYSSDNWATVKEAQASFANALAHTNGTLEKWQFDVPVSTDMTRIQVAVLYVANGTQYWDTNYNNRNYILTR